MTRLALATLAVMLGVACALPVDPYGHGGGGHYKPPPKPYNFEYGVEDPHYGPNFRQQEKSDGNSVQGSYAVQLPDGRQQIVTYTADHENGFYADVQYKGKAQYPGKSEHPPFIVPPHSGGGGYGH